MNDLREEVCLDIYFCKLDFASSLTFCSDPSEDLHSWQWPHASHGFCRPRLPWFYQHHPWLGRAEWAQGWATLLGKLKQSIFKVRFCCWQSYQRGEGKIILCVLDSSFYALFFSVTSIFFLSLFFQWVCSLKDSSPNTSIVIILFVVWRRLSWVRCPKFLSCPEISAIREF